MAIRQLTLRFRDASSKSGQSAIREHQTILAEHGKVLWGWWKRQDEADRDDLWRNCVFPLEVTLVSTSEQLQYCAKVSRIGFGPPADINLVPIYYRDDISSIHTWLELSEIKAEAYDLDLTDQIASRLNTAFSKRDLMTPVALQQTLKINGTSGKFVCISDIHLDPAEHSFLMPGESASASKSASAKEKIISLAQAIRIDLRHCGAQALDGIVVSGDIVSKGRWPLDMVVRFFEDLSNELSVPRSRIFCVPGNHDFFRQSDELSDTSPLLSYTHEHSYRAFRSQAFGIPILEPLNYSVFYQFADFEVRMGFLNSARWTATPGFSEYGFVGRDAYMPILNRLADEGVEHCWKMVVLHHHLLPVQSVERPGPKVERPVSITLDSVDLLSDAQQSNVNLIISGHQHYPDVKHIRQLSGPRTSPAGTFVLTGGSSGSTQIAPRAWNTYTLLEFGNAACRCRIREIDPSGRHSGNYADVEFLREN